jgi:hypothetical protein
MFSTYLLRLALMMKLNGFQCLSVVLVCLLQGCSSKPYYKDFWVGDMDANQRAMLWDACSLESDLEAAKYGKTLTLEGSDWVREANKIGNQIKVEKFHARTFSVCMRRSGFKLENLCARNCENQ